MEKQYIVEETPFGNKVISYEENGIKVSFLEDETNSDYQAYLRWLENPDEQQAALNEALPK